MQQCRCRVAVFSPDDRIKLVLENDAEIIWIPLIDIEPVEKCSKKVIEVLKKCSLAVLVSPRAIEILIKDAVKWGIVDKFLDLLRKSTIAVIGESTFNSISKLTGIKPQIISPAPYTRQLFEHLINKGIKCAVYIKSQSDAVNLKDMRRNIDINYVVIYRYRVLYENIEKIKTIVKQRKIDIILLTSYTIAKLFYEYIGSSIPREITIIAMGKTTATGLGREIYDNTRVIIGDGTTAFIKNTIKNLCLSMYC